MRKLIQFTCTLCIILCVNLSNAQDPNDILNQLNDGTEKEFIKGTFKTTRVILSHSVETVKKHNMDFRVSHRFGDFAGDAGGAETFFGLDNAADIRIAFEFGITDRLTLAIGRNKAGPAGPSLDGHIKYRALWQTDDNSTPLSLTLLLSSDWGIEKKPEIATGETLPARYSEYANRFSYVYQAIVGRKFNDRLSIEILPTFFHRNYVSNPQNENDIIAMGLAARYKITKRFALVADGYYVDKKPVSASGTADYQYPLGLGIEVETGGHVFSINFTNSGGIIENSFIPYTFSDWGKGEYRFGFNISRNFTYYRSKKDSAIQRDKVGNN
jgi:hypothetical protein